MTSKELLEHPSVCRELARFRSLGCEVLVGEGALTLYSSAIPSDITEAFATRIRRLDTEGLLTVRVGSEADGRVVTLLRRHSIPLETWGTGEAKTLDHLLTELAVGECTLVERDGRLIRFAEGAIVNVYHQDASGRHVLFEKCQVFTDGRSKVRTPDTSIGEKMKPGEHPQAAAHRALSEELGIEIPLALTPLGTRRKGPVESVSFPGLLTVYDMHAFEVTLPPELVKPEGYVEHQEDKDTYFAWKPADGA